jgi:hypothetical protein
MNLDVSTIMVWVVEIGTVLTYKGRMLVKGKEKSSLLHFSVV